MARNRGSRYPNGVNTGGLGSSYKYNAGTVNWAGTTVEVQTGLETIVGFTMSMEQTALTGTSPTTLAYIDAGGADGDVSIAALVWPAGGGTVAIQATGGIINWIALGV